MKKMNQFWMLLMLLFAIVACTAESDSWDNGNNSYNKPDVR